MSTTAPELLEGVDVLICDDTEALRKLLRLILTAAGLRPVGEAADGHEAIAEAERLQPDVILLDLAMPRLSGLDALPDLRRVAPHARIIVFSAFASSQIASQVMSLGAASYLEKGAGPARIVAEIEGVLERSRVGHAGLHAS